MSNLSLEEFVNFYIETVSEAVQENCLSNLNAFYELVFAKASEKTGFSIEEIIYLHNPFHWELFLMDYSPLELVSLIGAKSGYEIRSTQKNSPLEKEKIAKCILEKHGTYLQQRINRLSEARD